MADPKIRKGKARGRELVNLDIEEVSLVGAPANKKKFLLYKSATEASGDDGGGDDGGDGDPAEIVLKTGTQIKLKDGTIIKAVTAAEPKPKTVKTEEKPRQSVIVEVDESKLSDALARILSEVGGLKAEAAAV